ncbi:hypothetical protein BABINDRAFT_161258 [Babjeviella inositovora NRRL Y-12698]|uniref:BZIP domain-containing protein n=1 Tax=Babjeviella inositovora NRRL Y-12698 TaxID=984486 RepID=A0A1E3QRH8_9ASCO|nr:uncharacterized protein BABINDRAFT_161258 [Babjeviella inositovora NRRL Y-12698]ODQ80299.1 hypothetical protein BABINDRAFT_161258 [Babjeviella inositovora NRRL Y-12698]
MNNSFQGWAPASNDENSDTRIHKKEKLDHIDPSFSRVDDEGYSTPTDHDEVFGSNVAAAAVAAAAANDADHHLHHHGFHLDDQSVVGHVSLSLGEVKVDESMPLETPELGVSLGRKARRGTKGPTSAKRAEQNRNAQRSFRVRKELQIKELKDQADEAKALRATIEELRRENMHLRDYTLALQSKLMEHETGVPTPPSLVFGRNAAKDEVFDFDAKKK